LEKGIIEGDNPVCDSEHAASTTYVYRVG